MHQQGPLSSCATRLREVRRQAEVRPRLDCQADALGAAVLAQANCLSAACRSMARKRIMQAADEVVAVLRWQRHEGAAHKDELNLHDRHRRAGLADLHIQLQADMC